VKKKEAVLKAIGIFLAINAVLIFVHSVGRWLEIRPIKPSPPGFIFVAEGLLVLMAIQYYRRKVKGD
jgi:divalent metal cation (Fe/Co/Zn/Cd) transporter